jgi:hypothetical protein
MRNKTMSMNIKEALLSLDSVDDSFWTEEGSPRVDIIGNLIGRKTSREELVNTAPKFSRTNLDVSMEAEVKVADEISEEESHEEPLEGIDILESLDSRYPMKAGEFAEKVLNVLPKEALHSLEAILIAQVAEIDKRQVEMDAVRNLVKANLGSTRSWIKAYVPNTTDLEANQEYLRSQYKNRLAKAENMKKVLGAIGISDLSKLDYRSPIDRAMLRRTARGTQRPGQKV